MFVIRKKLHPNNIILYLFEIEFKKSLSISIPFKKIAGANSVVYSWNENKEPLIKFYHQYFQKENLQRIQEIDDWILNTGRGLAYETSDCRGKHDIISLSSWTERGGRAKIHYTPCTLDDRGWIFLDSFRDVWSFISGAIQVDFPITAVELLKAPRKIRSLDLFTYGNVNVTPVQKEHKDKFDYNLCAVIPTSDFEGGEIFFRYLNLSFVVKKGDMLVFDSRHLWHGVTASSNSRRSLVLTSHSPTINRSQNLANLRLKRHK